ncbi:MAG: hypothetical protein ACRDU8_08195 [Egibacteraceae bacterium]
MAGALVAILAACGVGGEPPELPSPAATVPSTPTETAPTDAAEEPTDATGAASGSKGDKPAEITKAHAQQVMDDIDGHLQEVAEDVRAREGFGEGFLARMDALYADTTIDAQIRDWRDIGVGGIRKNPGAPTTKVLKLIDGRQGCMFATAQRSFDEVFTKQLDVDQPYYLVLGSAKTKRFNDSGWQLYYDSFANKPEDPC